MHKVTYIRPGSNEEIYFGETLNLATAKALARETLVEWNMNTFAYGDKRQGIERDREAWRALAESSVKLTWIEGENGVVYGEGYDGGSLVLPNFRLIRIEPIAEESS